MGIRNRDGALYAATGIDNAGLYEGRREAMGIIKAMAGQITSFDVFSGIGISAATAFASAAKSSYDFEKEFRKNMLEVATISTQVEGSMTDFMNQVMSITQEIPVTAPEAAKALYQIVSAGHDGAAGMNVLEVAAKSAIGGITDTVTAADAITTLLNAYKLSADDAEKVSDQLFTTARLGKTTFGELGQSIAQVAPIAAAYGVEMDQVLAAVATLTKSGTPTAQAMTQIRASIIGTSKVLGDGAFDSMTFQEALAEIAKRAGGSEAELRKLIPEVEAVNGVLGMTGIKAQDAADHLKEMNNSVGATEAAFKLMMNDVDKQMTLLSNNIQAALRPMGQAILKEVSEVATAFNEAFDNGDAKEAMKTLGDLIVIVTGAFIGYKGAVLASTAVQRINTAILRQAVLERQLEKVALLNGVVGHQALTAAQLKEIAARKIVISTIKVQTAAMLKNLAAFATNPYIWAAAAISFLGYQVYKYATQATAAEKAQKRFNDRIDDQKNKSEEYKTKIEGLIDTVKSETDTEYERNKALKALKDLYPDIFKKYDIETLKLADILSLKKQIAEIEEQRAFQSDKNHFGSLVGKRDELDKELSYRSTNYGNGQYKYAKYQDKTVDELRKDRELISCEIDLIHSGLREKSAEVWDKSTPKEVKIISLEKNIESLKKEQEDLDVLVNKKKDENSLMSKIASPIDIARLEVVNGLIKEQSEELNSLKKISSSEGTVAAASITEEIKDATTKVSTLKQELTDLRNGKTSVEAGKTVEEVIEGKVKDLNAAEKALSTLTGKDDKSSNEAGKLLKTQSDLSRSILESELKLQSDRIAIMQDGKDKRVLLADQEYKETLASIQKEREAYLKDVKDSGGKESPTALATFDKRGATAKDKRDINVANIDKEYSDEYIGHIRALTDVFLNEEQRKLSAIKERYDKEREWANTQLSTGGITKDQHKEYSTNIDKAQTKENYKSLLDNLNDYKQQEKDIRDNWDTKIKAATDAKDAYLVAKLMEGKQKSLSALSAQMLQESDEWKQLFGNLDDLTADQLDNLIKTIRSKAKGLKLNPVDMDAVTNNLKEAETKLRTVNPFKSLVTSINEYKKAEDDVTKKKSLKDMLNSSAASIDLLKGGFDSVVSGLTDMGLAGDEMTQELLGDISNLMGAASQLATGIASGNPMSIIQGGIGLLSSAFNIFNNDRKHERKIRSLQDEVENLEKAYDKLSRAIDNTFSNRVDNMMDEQEENMRKQQEAIRQQIREEEDKKKTDKDKIKEWQNELNELDNKIEDSNRKQIEMWAGTDALSAIDEYANAIVDAYSKGEDGAKAMADTTKKVLANAVKESLKKRFLADALQGAVAQLGKDMEDGVLSDNEKKNFENSTKSAGDRFMEAMKLYDDLFKDAETELKDGVSGQLQAAMTEGTASQLVGLWNSTAIDMRELKNINIEERDSVKSILSFVDDIVKQSYLIEQNTKRGADNTDGLIDELREGFHSLDKRLGNIEKNTKSSNSRG